MKGCVALFLVLHGALHLIGAGQGFRLWTTSALERPIGPVLAGVWLLAAAGFFVFALSLWLWLDKAWLVGLVAIAVSQAAVFSSWSDAKWGSWANVLAAFIVVYLFFSEGPASLHRRYIQGVSELLSTSGGAPTLTEGDLHDLPAPVAQYIRRSGAVGRPRPSVFFVRLRGQIRGGSEDDWMEFTSTQVNRIEEPTRLFFMKAKKMGLPVDVFHRFTSGAATMHVRLLSLLPMASDSGPSLTRAETVTLFNDLCLFSPAALLSERVTWEQVGDREVVGRYSVGENAVSATLTFDESGDLKDFASPDRLMRTKDGSFVGRPWSTPISEYAEGSELRVMSRGEALWHGDEPFAYLRVQVIEHWVR